MGGVSLLARLRLVRHDLYHVMSPSLIILSGLLFAGRMSDLFGRKMLYLGGLATFSLFSILSAVVKVSQPTVARPVI